MRTELHPAVVQIWMAPPVALSYSGHQVGHHPPSVLKIDESFVLVPLAAKSWMQKALPPNKPAALDN